MLNMWDATHISEFPICLKIRIPVLDALTKS
jgi:hypothetical protein